MFGKAFTDLKHKYGVPERLHACHTALIDGYVIEGHVPADLINKLLKEKPAVRWLGGAWNARRFARNGGGKT